MTTRHAQLRNARMAEQRASVRAEQRAERTRRLSDYVTPAVVRASRAAESDPTDAHLAAVDYIGVASLAHADSPDVASLARLFLASVPSRYAPRRRAVLACASAARALSALSADYVAHVVPVDGTGADETDAPRSTLARTTFGTPTRAVDWQRADTLATVGRALGARRSAGVIGPDTPAATTLALLATPNGWTDKGTPNVSAVASVLYGSTSGPARQRARAVVSAVLDVARTVAPDVTVQTPAGDSPASAVPPTLERDTRIPASGPASVAYVERPMPWPPMLAGMPDVPARVGTATWPAGTLGTWQRTPTTRYATDESARHALRLAALSASRVLAAYSRTVGRAAERETTRASITAHVEQTRTVAARRPAGVGIGVRYGAAGLTAGGGAPDARPVTRRRKNRRAGGVGGPMLTGPSGTGTGPSTAGTLDVAYGARRCLCVRHDDLEPYDAPDARWPADGAYCPAHDVHGHPGAPVDRLTDATADYVVARRLAVADDVARIGADWRATGCPLAY